MVSLDKSNYKINNNSNKFNHLYRPSDIKCHISFSESDFYMTFIKLRLDSRRRKSMAFS
jgi:hypothetical protein